MRRGRKARPHTYVAVEQGQRPTRGLFNATRVAMALEEPDRRELPLRALSPLGECEGVGGEGGGLEGWRSVWRGSGGHGGDSEVVDVLADWRLAGSLPTRPPPSGREEGRGSGGRSLGDE